MRYINLHLHYITLHYILLLVNKRSVELIKKQEAELSQLTKAAMFRVVENFALNSL